MMHCFILPVDALFAAKLSTRIFLMKKIFANENRTNFRAQHAKGRTKGEGTAHLCFAFDFLQQ